MGQISSSRSTNLTDGLWDAETGLNDDKLPEVPPDGRLTEDLTLNPISNAQNTCTNAEQTCERE